MESDWVRQHLLSDSGFKRKFAHEIRLFKGPLSEDAYFSRTIASEIAATVTRQGTVGDLVRLLLRDDTGDWLYAGWIDQAVLHVGVVRRGDISLFGIMLAQIDEDQVDQSGDMLVAFVRQDRDWILTIEVSSDDSMFEVRLRTDHESEARRAMIHATADDGA